MNVLSKHFCSISWIFFFFDQDTDRSIDRIIVVPMRDILPTIYEIISDTEI